MAKQFSLPFENVISINKSGEISAVFLKGEIESFIQDGVSIILKEDQSTKLEGGFLFNIILNSERTIDVYSIHKRKMLCLNNFEELTKLINHQSGRKFDHEQWLISQQLNFLLFNEEIAPH